jgi:hypothetical protein
LPGGGGDGEDGEVERGGGGGDGKGGEEEVAGITTKRVPGLGQCIKV